MKEKIYPANTNQKKAEKAMLSSDRSDLKVRKVIQNKEKPYIMLKGSIFQEDITIPTTEHQIT